MRSRGFTLVELIISLSLLLMGIVGFQMLFAAGLRTALRTNASTVLTQQNAQGIRRITGTLNEAISATITLNNTRIDYVLPKRSAVADTITGQKEFIIPLEPDGTTRYFQVVEGKLKDESGRTLIRDIVATELDPNSTQFSQTYQPFQFTTIGGTRAVTVNFVTAVMVGNRRYAKMKSTVLLRNAL